LPRLRLLTVIYLSAFMGPFGGSMVVAMFPELKRVFAVDVAVMALTVTVFMIPYSILQLFFGPLSDIYGRKRVVAAGLSVYTAGALLAAASTSIASFMASRLVQGVGAAIALPVAMAMLGDEFPPSQLGKAMGGYSVAITLGNALGPLTGGLMATLDWRLAFIVMALPPLAVILLLKGWKSARPPRRRETVKVFRVLATPTVLFTGLIGFMVFTVMIGVYTFTADALGSPPYLLASERIGYYLSLAGFTGLAAGPLAGALSDRFGRTPTILLGLLLLSVALLLLAAPGWSTLMPPIMILVGAGSTTAFTSLGAVSVEVAPQARGTAASLYGFLRFLGYALGPILLLPAYHQLNVQGVALTSQTAIATGLLLLLTLKRSLATRRKQ